MTATEDRPADLGVPGLGRSGSELPAPEDRGGLAVSPAVVRKLAQHVADRAPGTLRAPRRVTGTQGSSATVHGEGSSIDIALDVALRYPAPVREITEQIRHEVTDEVRRTTGLRVRAVTFTVSALLPETRPRVE